MREEIQRVMEGFIADYIRENNLRNMWKKPVIKYADAGSAGFGSLPQIVVEGHHHPKDYLDSASVVISYFLPFQEWVGDSNKEGRKPSDVWGEAYDITNRMAAELNEYLAQYLNGRGYAAAVPTDAGLIEEVNKSRWSQRHVAYLAGHGTFGMNNMLISDMGCTGRYFSVVADIAVETDEVFQEERCLYKRNKSCGICMRRCIAEALTPDGFKREVCAGVCNENRRLNHTADICGKCTVGLPCSYRPPIV